MNDGFDRASQLAIDAANKAAEANTPEPNATDPGQNSTENNSPAAGAEANNPPAGTENQQTPPAGGEATPPAGEQQQPVDPTLALAKEMGYESVEQMKLAVKKKDEKTESPEEIERKKQVYEANLASFAVEEGLMNLDDIHKLQTLKGKDDRSLVFERFSADVRDEIAEQLAEENKENALEPPTEREIEDKIKEAFEREYPLTSKNEKAKARAENRIKKEAGEMRGPLESSLNTVKERFDEVVTLKNAMPEFQKTLTKVVTEAIPNSYTAYEGKDGDEVLNVAINISDDDQKELNKQVLEEFRKPKYMKLFREGKVKDMQEEIQAHVEVLLLKKYNAEAKVKIAEFFESRGKTKGSNIGAENRFSENQARNKQSDKPNLGDARKQVLDSTRQKKQ